MDNAVMKVIKICDLHATALSLFSLFVIGSYTFMCENGLMSFLLLFLTFLFLIPQNKCTH